MDAYHIALFLHIVTLAIAAGATAVTKLAAARRSRARTLGEALEWHRTMTSASRLFPICLALFLGTGMYMVKIAGMQFWSSGFLVAGLTGVVLLLASGTFLGVKARGLEQLLAKMAESGADHPPPTLLPPRLVAMLPVLNTGIALSVVFDMVTKPASIPVALGTIAIGIIVAAAASFRSTKWTASLQSGLVIPKRANATSRMSITR